MRDFLLEVLSLQREWTSRNTPAMQRRGVLIRDEIPAWMRSHASHLAAALGHSGEDLEFEGRDGTGLKTEIPWVRFFSLMRAPRATEGWYVVYLFDAKGEGVFLSVAHGSTKFVNGEFKPRPEEELRALVHWGRETLRHHPLQITNLTEHIELNSRGRLGRAYEQSCVISRWYPANDLPTDAALLDDQITFARLLGHIYDAEDLGRSFESADREAEQVQAVVRSGISTRGQGFGLTAQERKAVEQHAMQVARSFLESEGYEVQDTSANRPFDFIATKAGQQSIVEVKGSTGPAESILLTANEVLAHRKHFPHNILIIVHSICMERELMDKRTYGGVLFSLKSWQIDDSCLTPLAYQYKPLGGFSSSNNSPSSKE